MRIGFVAGTLGCGGAERQLLFMLSALKNAGADLKLLCLTRGERYEEAIRELGVDIEWIGSSGSRISRIRNTVQAFRSFKPDVIQSAHFYTNIYSATAGYLLRTPNIGAIRNDVTSEVAANRPFGALLLRLPGHLIANSRIGVERAVSMGIRREQIDFLPNAVDVPTEGNTYQRDSLTILFVGRLVPAKRPDLFIRMASDLIKAMPEKDIHFRIVGDGPLWSDLVAMRDRLGISSDKVAFSGEVHDMHEVYSQADILALTSEHEGTPNVVLEAMAHGLPVVASRVGGVADLLVKGGVTVGRNDTELFRATLTDLIRSPVLRESIGKAGREQVHEHHSITSVRDRLVGIHELLLRRCLAHG